MTWRFHLPAALFVPVWCCVRVVFGFVTAVFECEEGVQITDWTAGVPGTWGRLHGPSRLIAF